MVDAVMDKTACVQFVVAAQAIGINNTVRHDFLYNNRHQSIGLGIIYGNSLDPSVAFQNAEDNNFPCHTVIALAVSPVQILRWNSLADEVFNSTIELDKSYFAGCNKGRCTHSVTSKVVVLYILKQQVSLTLIRHSSSLQSCGVGMRFRTDLHQSHKIASTPS